MAHVTHHVEQFQKLKKEAKDATETLLTQLYKAQLGEIARTKQVERERKKENVKQSVLMVTTQPTAVPTGAAPPVTQPQTQVTQVLMAMQPNPTEFMYHMGPPLKQGPPS